MDNQLVPVDTNLELAIVKKKNSVMYLCVILIIITSCAKINTHNASYKNINDTTLDAISMRIILSEGATNFSGIERMINIELLVMTILDNIDTIDFSPLKSLTNLKYIELRGRGLTRLPDLGNIQSLERIELDKSRLTNLNGIEKIASNGCLYITISQNSEVITDISALRYLKNLKSLTIYDTRINMDYSALGELPELEELIIGGGADQEINLTGISQLKSLRKLHLESNTNRSAFAIGERCQYLNIEEIGRMSGLKELYLDESISSVEFLRNNINLERLEILADFERSDFGKVFLPLDVSPLSNLVNLKYLSIQGFELKNADFLLASLPGVDRIIEIYEGDR